MRVMIPARSNCDLPAVPASFHEGLTLARLDLARGGLHPDLLPRPPEESEYLRELSQPDPVSLYISTRTENPDK